MCTLPTENQDAFITVHVLAHFILLWQSVFRVANVAISFLLQFFSLFVYHLSVVTQLKYIRALAEAFPNTIIKARRIIGMNCDKFQNYVCCPKCCSIYELDDCYEKIGTCKVPRRCSFIRFPRHPILSKRKACESNILKRIKTTKKEMYSFDYWAFWLHGHYYLLLLLF